MGSMDMHPALRLCLFILAQALELWLHFTISRGIRGEMINMNNTAQSADSMVRSFIIVSELSSLLSFG